ncbi:transcription factor bHLH53-like [Pyrus x bretschneideri]|uniref:transcription factor bHLH53-like n=1 Tax=Pyrus x bretschneideri TaxID=225117 RepID=UPI00202DE942|nr:transcription factor bHLH53-like [Pyrus x bretschneideri]
MAMSTATFCPIDDWGSLQLLNPPEMNMLSLPTQQKLQAASSGIFDLQDYYYSLANSTNPEYTCIDPFFQPYESSSENFLLPDFCSPTDNINLALLSPETCPTLDEYDFSYQPYPKCQKLFHDQQVQYCNSNFVNQPEAAKLDNKVVSGTGTVSPQSIAARERRRKITEKTQELGRLIPGATKMNTAEMLQAAYKYVKFLRAQVSVLKLMTDSPIQQERKEERLYINQERLQVAASPIIQEKLYSEEKCLVLKEFVEVLAKDDDIQSKPFLKDKVAQLLQTNG